MNTTAIRGSVFSCIDDPRGVSRPKDGYLFLDDGTVVMEDGLIASVGPASDILPTLPAGTNVQTFEHGLIVPGFIDCHIHYPQTEIVAGYGETLLDWLDKQAFVAEQKFEDLGHATRIADLFLGELFRNGTTTAVVFGTSHKTSADAFFNRAAAADARMIAGKVWMDRNAPSALCDTAQSAYDDSKALIDTWHGKGRLAYAITPRFAITSTEAQLEAAGHLAAEHPDVYIHSHLSEQLGELDEVARLFPNDPHYTGVYERFGLLRERSIYAHGIHLAEDELQMLHDRRAMIAHSPTSNLFLGSGLFDFDGATDPKRPVAVGLATDVGGGTSFSMFRTMDEAFKINRLRGGDRTPLDLFYAATMGAARALELGDEIGSLRSGNEADVTVIDLAATALIAERTAMARDQGIQELLFVLQTLGDDRMIEATYVAGEKIYTRP